MKNSLLAGLTFCLVLFGIAAFAGADMIVSQDLGVDAYTASSFYPGNTPDLAFDGDFSTIWNAGAHPIRWIEVDLGGVFNITEILLSVEQDPAPAETIHEVWISSSTIGDDTSGAYLSYTFSGITDNGQLLTADFSTPLTAQFVQIRTTYSPSWVAWDEIQVSGTPVPEPASMLLLGAGLIGIAGARRKFKK